MKTKKTFIRTSKLSNYSPKTNKKINSPQKQTNDENKSTRIDILTSQIMEKKGCNNYLQGVYYKDVSSVVMDTNNPYFYFVKPHISIKNTLEWRLTMLFVIRYLKKYKMETTLSTISQEYPNITKSLNLRELTSSRILFDDLLVLSEDIGSLGFRDKVEKFFSENSITLPESNSQSLSHYK